MLIVRLSYIWDEVDGLCFPPSPITLKRWDWHNSNYILLSSKQVTSRLFSNLPLDSLALPQMASDQTPSVYTTSGTPVSPLLQTARNSSSTMATIWSVNVDPLDVSLISFVIPSLLVLWSSYLSVQRSFWSCSIHLSFHTSAKIYNSSWSSFFSALLNVSL